MTIPAILLATHNPNKRVELRRALAAPAERLLGPDDVAPSDSSPPPEPVEDGTTYRANATIKARAFSAWSGLTALADDSGLEVDALGGRPGVSSARYAGPGADGAANLHKLLEELREVPPERRGARFVCVLVLCRGDETLLEVEGECRGWITERARGEGGFGYDPVFVPDGELLTFAEMEREEKDRISHRGRALEELRSALRSGRLPIDLTFRP